MLMDKVTFQTYEEYSVPEPTLPTSDPHHSLSSNEQELYHCLASRSKGGPEQEFLPSTLVHQSLEEWHQAVKGS